MPFFALVSAAKETLIGQLSVVIVLARHLPSFWIRDAEMISIAVLSDASRNKAKTTGDADSPWARLRIGQSLILVELLRGIRQITKTKKDPNAVSFSKCCIFYY
ncbi:MAG TPA: hypothetical protein VGO47_03085 [Chlamydiales bacterium]|nr:hypothetical protein [Chlamydiales bacterium]